MKTNSKKENLTYLKKIFRRLSADKNLKPQERALWNEFLVNAEPSIIKDLDGLLNDETEMLSALTKNLFDKYTASIAGDPGAWDQIFESEIQKFSSKNIGV